MNLQFDWTINISDLVLGGSLLAGALRLWLYQRDFNQKVLYTLGRRAPRDDRMGILGDVAHLQEQLAFQEDVIDLHHRVLNLDRRTHERRGVGDSA